MITITGSVYDASINAHVLTTNINGDIGSIVLPSNSYSKSYIDGSLNDIRDNYVSNASLGDAFDWESGLLQVANLSGTNTGDETEDSIKTKLGINTLSGDNTGDKLSYVLHANCAALGTPTVSTTYYYGSSGTTPTPNNDRCRIYFPKAGRIKSAFVHCWMNTVSSAESWPFYIRINNTVDYLIDSIANTVRNKVWSNVTLDIAVNVGDYFEIKFVTPAWTSVPTTLVFNTVIYVEA